jgi:hypothetical protein
MFSAIFFAKASCGNINKINPTKKHTQKNKTAVSSLLHAFQNSNGAWIDFQKFWSQTRTFDMTWRGQTEKQHSQQYHAHRFTIIGELYANSTRS